MKGELGAFGFVAIVALVCSILLAGADRIAGPRKAANEKADEIRSILAALDIPIPEKAAPADLTQIFEDNVRVSETGELTLYKYVPAGKVESEAISIAVPFEGAGLWGPIFGIAAFEPDLTTVRAVKFYKQEETPGLGGEIGGKAFQDSFAGKQIVSADGKAGFFVKKPGSEPQVNAVDGISGATMTCDRVQMMLDNLARQISEVRNNHGG